MTSRSTLALVVHFHQPVGNLDRIVARATDRCYRPFLEVLDAHPGVPMTLHYSGCLLQWLQRRAPDVVRRLAELVGRGQVELMTGGLYEPILAALPGRDRVGQIRAYTELLRDTFGAEPTGLWLTERVWEPDVIEDLVAAGVAYTVLDDTMFHSVGITDQAMTGPFVTESGGRPLLVYPGDRTLRYLIPYRRVERVLSHLRTSLVPRLFVYGDDGEKFGEWPGTDERVYAQGWLDRFLGALEHGDVPLTTLGAHAADAEPAGRVYLPSSSYDELMTWALPTEARLTLGRFRRRREAQGDPDGILGFARGAPWRAFLAKYPEIDQLHKRMLGVSDAVHRAGAPAHAVAELYRAQCNCAYWHGSFGGVYLAFMRAALWHHLMRAEAALSPPRGVELVDLDADLRPEGIVRGSWGAAVVRPHDGGIVVELDDHRFGANLLATMTRYREAYHVEDESPPGDGDEDEMDAAAVRGTPAAAPGFDDHRRAGLVDAIGDTRIASYDAVVDGDRLVLTASAAGASLTRRMWATPDGLAASYRIEAPDGLDSAFRCETSVLPLCLGRETPEPDIRHTPDGLVVGAPEAEVILSISWDRTPEVAATTIETYSATLEGLLRMRQGAEVILSWPLALAPGEAFEVTLTFAPVVTAVAGTKRDPGVGA